MGVGVSRSGGGPAGGQGALPGASGFLEAGKDCVLRPLVGGFGEEVGEAVLKQQLGIAEGVGGFDWW